MFLSRKSFRSSSSLIKRNHGLKFRNKLSISRFYSDFKEVKDSNDVKPDLKEDANVNTMNKSLSQEEIEQLVQNAKARAEKMGDKIPTESEKNISFMEENEKEIGSSESHEFQAETKKILDIVARSLYSERDVFIRELISNCSDALEKLRSYSLSGEKVSDPEVPSEIRINVDPDNMRFIVQDTGIGMTKEELIENLGHIGHSGTGAFVKILENRSDADNFIGQFGVGFYSAFMAGHKIKVYSKSAKSEEGYVWESDGSGSYSIRSAEGVTRGTKVIVYLREDAEKYAQRSDVESIIKQHSNFVNYPILLNGNKVNTIRALWTESPENITQEEHEEFYRFISKTYDKPIETIQFKTDSPISIKALLYVPQYHTEKYGINMEPGVSLFCRKVLIQHQCKGLLPEWLRFVKGVVDCDDIPLNISREHLQDSSVIKRLSNIITNRVIKHLRERMKKDPASYKSFYKEYKSPFLQQGVATDHVHKDKIADLLLFESSEKPSGELISLAEYVENMPKDQKNIYYFNAPSRAIAEQSPYYEPFKEDGTQVILSYSKHDEFTFSAIKNYKGMKLVSIESSEATPKHKPKTDTSKSLSREQFVSFAQWFKETLEDSISTVMETDRNISAPCIVVATDTEAAAQTKILQYYARLQSEEPPKMAKQEVKINSSHPIIKKLNIIRSTQPELAKDIAEQIFDNALVTAGLVDFSSEMAPRVNRLLNLVIPDSVLENEKKDDKDIVDYKEESKEEKIKEIKKDEVKEK